MNDSFNTQLENILTLGSDFYAALVELKDIESQLETLDPKDQKSKVLLQEFFNLRNQILFHLI